MIYKIFQMFFNKIMKKIINKKIRHFIDLNEIDKSQLQEIIKRVAFEISNLLEWAASTAAPSARPPRLGPFESGRSAPPRRLRPRSSAP